MDESQLRAVETLHTMLPRVNAHRSSTWVTARRFERPDQIREVEIGDAIRKLADENKRKLKLQQVAMAAARITAATGSATTSTTVPGKRKEENGTAAVENSRERTGGEVDDGAGERKEETVTTPSTSSSNIPRKPKKVEKTIIYLYGGVGTGKTMIMDLFGAELRAANHKVLRVHFYEFVVDFHRGMQTTHRDGFTKVESYANKLCDEWDALCLDEMQLCDVQDMVMVPVILDVLSQRGLIVVLTSNTEPNSLYTDGLNRHIHLPPLLKVLERSCLVRGTKTAKDFRLPGDKGKHYETSDALNKAFLDTTRGAATEKKVIEITQTLRFEVGSATEEGVCWIPFAYLCERDVGEMEYIHLCRRFSHIFIPDVPRFRAIGDHGPMRRFIKFIDILYDNSPRPALSISGPPNNEIFEEITREVSAHDFDSLALKTAKHSMGGLGAGMSPAAVGVIFEAVRSSTRAISRLKEICP